MQNNRCPVCNTTAKKYLKKDRDSLRCLRCGYVHKDATKTFFRQRFINKDEFD